MAFFSARCVRACSCARASFSLSRLFLSSNFTRRISSAYVLYKNFMLATHRFLLLSLYTLLVRNRHRVPALLHIEIPTTATGEASLNFIGIVSGVRPRVTCASNKGQEKRYRQHMVYPRGAAPYATASNRRTAEVGRINAL